MTDRGHAELTQFFVAQLTTLGRQLSDPFERGDSCFVVEALPPWLGSGLSMRLDVLPMDDAADGTARFLVAMIVDFGTYHRRMDLTAGDISSVRAFAEPDGKCGHLATAVLELMDMERSGA